MKNFKKIFLPIISVILIIGCIAVIFIILPKNNKPIASSSKKTEEIKEQTLKETAEISDTVILALVIQSEIKEAENIYTLQITNVYKGKNLTGIGYLHCNDKLSLNKNYLLFLSNGTAKYHYNVKENYYYAFESEDNKTFKISDEVNKKNVVFKNQGFTVENLKENLN